MQGEGVAYCGVEGSAKALLQFSNHVLGGSSLVGWNVEKRDLPYSLTAAAQREEEEDEEEDKRWDCIEDDDGGRVLLRKAEPIRSGRSAKDGAEEDDRA